MNNDTLIIVLLTNHYNLLLLLARLFYYIHLYYVKCHLVFAYSGLYARVLNTVKLV